MMIKQALNVRQLIGMAARKRNFQKIDPNLYKEFVSAAEAHVNKRYPKIKGDITFGYSADGKVLFFRNQKLIYQKRIGKTEAEKQFRFEKTGPGIAQGNNFFTDPKIIDKYYKPMFADYVKRYYLASRVAKKYGPEKLEDAIEGREVSPETILPKTKQAPKPTEEKKPLTEEAEIGATEEEIERLNQLIQSGLDLKWRNCIKRAFARLGLEYEHPHKGASFDWTLQDVRNIIKLKEYLNKEFMDTINAKALLNTAKLYDLADRHAESLPPMNTSTAYFTQGGTLYAYLMSVCDPKFSTTYAGELRKLKRPTIPKATEPVDPFMIFTMVRMRESQLLNEYVFTVYRRRTHDEFMKDYRSFFATFLRDFGTTIKRSRNRYAALHSVIERMRQRIEDRKR
jgi:hypothetical protein